jgi:hypothetical protein
MNSNLLTMGASPIKRTADMVSAGKGVSAAVLPEVPLQAFQERRWCANCAGAQTFIPVERLPFGWRGYCLGCEEEKYVMEERTSA